MFTAREMIDRLTSFFLKDESSNNFKLFKMIESEIALVNETTQRVIDWRDVDKAEGAALDRLGVNVNQPRGRASDEVYRVLIKSKIARSLSDGTINKIIEIVSIALNMEPTEISIIESWTDGGEHAAIRVDEVPIRKLNEIGMQITSFIELINAISAAGVVVERVSLEGTFEFGTTALEVDTEKGLASLDDSVGGILGAIFESGDDGKIPL